MEAEVAGQYPDAAIELIAGSGGIFDIHCDGRLIFSKKETPDRRFPNDGEVVSLLK